MRKDTHSPLDIQRILKFRNIAVVGMSKNEEKPAHFLPKYLIDHGYNVIPVNPTVMKFWKEVISDCLGIPENVDVVDIFRRSEDVPAVVNDAITKKGRKVIWMQSGIYNEEAERKAIENGIDVVFNRCMMVEHRHFL